MTPTSPSHVRPGGYRRTQSPPAARREAHRSAGAGRHGRRAGARSAPEGVRDERPHSIAVTIEEMHPREGRTDLIDVYAQLFVERSSQKAIVMGRGGARLKAVGSAARKQIEALLGTQVYLDLHVKVAKEWQRDPKQLRRLGF